MKFCPFCGNSVGENSKFCSECGSKLIQSDDSTNKTCDKNNFSEKNEQYNIICNYCGAALTYFNAICPSCGMETGSKAKSEACIELCEELDKIERSRPQPSAPTTTQSVVAAVAKTFGNYNYKDPTQREKEQIDEIIINKKAEAISRFVVPNNKCDILEFLFMAKTNAEASPDEELCEIWEKKYEEVYNKACFFLSSDPEFALIRRKREQEEAEEIARRENTFSRQLTKLIVNKISDRFNL